MNRLKGFAARRPSIIAGAVGAVVALAALIEWPAPGLQIIETALAWISLLLAALAMLTLPVATTRIRAIVALVLGVLGFGFWLLAQGPFAPVPLAAYLITAAAHVGLGFLVPPQRPQDARSVLIAAAGTVVFIIVAISTRLSQ